MTRLGKEIRKARIEQDMSQAALQTLTGIAFRHLSAIERGDIDPRWTTVVKIALALDMNLDAVAWQMRQDGEDATAEVSHDA